MPQKQFNIRAPQEIIDALSAEAQKQDRPLSWVIRAALSDYLASHGHNVVKPVRWGGYRPTVKGKKS